MLLIEVKNKNKTFLNPNYLIKLYLFKMGMIMKNKRGLSAIVATLIIILLVLVAVGIIWVVVRNLLQEGAESIDIGTKCLAVDVRYVGVVPGSGAGNYSVTLRRTAGGETIGGIKMTLFNETANSGVLDGFLALSELETRTETVVAGINNASRLEFTVYFEDESGNEAFCSQTNTYSF